MTRAYSLESAIAHKAVGDPNHAELARYLDVNGDGTGSKNMNTTAATYRLSPPTGMMYIIDEIRIVGWDDQVAAGVTFMGITALTNGCKLEIRSKPGTSPETVVEDLTDGVSIKSNGDLACLGETILFNQGAESLVQCSIKGTPYRLEGSKGESLVFQTQDTLTTITGLHVMALGRAYTNII